MQYMYKGKWVEANDKKPGMSTHKKISFVKSGLRLIACGIGVLGGLYMDFETILIGFALLGAAEILGVYEEMGEK